MKLTQTIGIASALLLAAGCAHEERSMQADGTVSSTYSSYPAPSEYNTQNKLSLPPSGRTYSQGKPSRSDNSIVSQVREALRSDPKLASVVPNIQITSANGAIILNGSVQSEEQKHQVMAKVLEVNGVVAVNNQLTVMSGPNGQGSQLNPTSNSAADRLYKDAANGPDPSTNNVLNPTSRGNGASQLYRESNQGEKSGPGNELNPTSRENGSSQIYQGNPGEKTPDQNSNTNNSQQMP